MMDVSKISAKVARMAPVREEGKILSEIEPVSLDEIHRMQKKAEEEGKTLAEVFSDEADPDTFKTVSIEELAAIAAKAKEEGVSPGSLLREFDKTGELGIEKEEEEEELEDVLPPPPPAPPAPPTPPAPSDEPDSPVTEPAPAPKPESAPEDHPTEVTAEEYKAIIGARTRDELKEFAAANSLEFSARIPTVKLIDLIAESVEYDLFDSYFRS